MERKLLVSWRAAALAAMLSAAPLAGAQSKLPRLPDPKDTAHNFYISARNSSQFQDFLIAPLAAWLKDGKLVLRAAREPGFAWKLSPEWLAHSMTNYQQLSLDGKANLKLNAGAEAQEGFPFGDAQAINREADPQARANRILWNISYMSGASRDIMYGLELDWLGEKNIIRRAGGVFHRSVAFNPPAPAKPEEPRIEFSGQDDVLFKEFLHLLSPPVVYGFSSLTWRYRGPREDDVWTFSPVIGRSRRIFEANRSDLLLDSLFVLEDFFVWSGKVQNTQATVAEEKQFLVPFGCPEIVRARTEPVVESSFQTAQYLQPGETEKTEEVLTARGPYRRSDGQTTAVLWNHQTGLYPQSSGWIPTSSFFVPRRVWILELSPLDPFSLLGRQVLVVDQETMLPVYKVVYDRRGVYNRTVIGGWCLAVGEKDEARFPFAAFVLAVDRSASKASAMTTVYARTFRGARTALSAKASALLNISEYEKKAESRRQAVQEEEPPPEAPESPAAAVPEPAVDE